MKIYNFNVNGYMIQAQYDESDIENVFKPLIYRWYNLWKDKKDRVIIYIAAAPGSGKSTLVAFLEHLFNTMDFDCKLQCVGMDGFHFYNSYLEEHSLMNEKGSQNTFDVYKLKEKIQETKNHSCFWPVYSRNLHDPIENQIYVDGDIVLIEGNYLLSKEYPWNECISECDDSLFIEVEEKELRSRLIERKSKGLGSIQEAEIFYELSDHKNIEFVMNTKMQANIEIKMKDNKVNDMKCR